MVVQFIKRLFGSPSDRKVSKLRKTVAQINALEKDFEALTDEQLKAKTTEFRERLKKGETLDQLMVEAFATVRETAKRTLGQRHHDVQLIGGIILHQGDITEMRTGEGKTLTSTLAIYLNALDGKGVHVVTVNDYLAERDPEWMGKIYRFLGMTVGCVIANNSDAERQAAYACDITYGTNNEFGFDYLRDNMKFAKEELVQRPFNFALVDEVDNILIDEARTPLIISGPAEDSSDLYTKVDAIIPQLKDEDYEKEEKNHQVTLTEAGNERVEELLKKNGILKEGQLYDLQNMLLVHHAQQALRAHKMYQRDKDYIIQDGKVILIDEFTGRMMDGRRFSDGLHQALEAKEKVQIQLENQTLASITFQNYFRMYPKLAGMTGTGETEAEELQEIYGLDVVVVPTNVPIVREDHDDEVYRTKQEKFDAIIKLVKECQARQQPVLLGTATIEQSEYLSILLKKAGVKHSVLNARFHEQEAKIIAQAGQPGTVTIATNMAGRGTDIQLGGNLEMLMKIEYPDRDPTPAERKKWEENIKKNQEIVKKAGGLYVIGTERHESRRIDNQLRGRSGRQGDPGASKFFLSLEDDLMRIFGPQRLDTWLQKLGMEEGEAITHPWVTKSLQRAQKKVEARNFDIRKQLLKYDDVMNDQRTAIYEQRRELLENEDGKHVIDAMREETLVELVAQYIPAGVPASSWDAESLQQEVHRIFNLELPIKAWADEEGIAEREISERLRDAVEKAYQEKEEKFTPRILRYLERATLLRLMDNAWKDHLRALDSLRGYIHLRAYGQRNPLNEFKSEAFAMFVHMMEELKRNTTQMLSFVQVEEDTSRKDIQEALLGDASVEGEAVHPEAQSALSGDTGTPTPEKPIVEAGKGVYNGEQVNRNAPCPCGSGKRFKHCHGRV